MPPRYEPTDRAFAGARRPTGRQRLADASRSGPEREEPKREGPKREGPKREEPKREGPKKPIDVDRSGIHIPGMSIHQRMHRISTCGTTMQQRFCPNEGSAARAQGAPSN